MRRMGLSRFAARTCAAPSAWWLQLYYGITHRSVFWQGQIVYRIRVLQLILRKLIRKIGWIR